MTARYSRSNCWNKLLNQICTLSLAAVLDCLSYFIFQLIYRLSASGSCGRPEWTVRTMTNNIRSIEAMDAGSDGNVMEPVHNMPRDIAPFCLWFGRKVVTVVVWNLCVPHWGMWLISVEAESEDAEPIKAGMWTGRALTRFWTGDEPYEPSLEVESESTLKHSYKETNYS